MNVRVRLFAVARQLAGRDVLELELPERSTIADVRQGLAAEVPDLAPLAAHMAFAMDSQYVRDDAVVGPGADVACIPPVSGG